jgi:hypothetical protein
MYDWLWWFISCCLSFPFPFGLIRAMISIYIYKCDSSTLICSISILRLSENWTAETNGINRRCCCVSFRHFWLGESIRDLLMRTSFSSCFVLIQGRQRYRRLCRHLHYLWNHNQPSTCFRTNHEREKHHPIMHINLNQAIIIYHLGIYNGTFTW